MENVFNVRCQKYAFTFLLLFLRVYVNVNNIHIVALLLHNGIALGRFMTIP